MTEMLFTLLLAVLPACPTDEAIGTCGWDDGQGWSGSERVEYTGDSFIVIDGVQWVDPR